MMRFALALFVLMVSALPAWGQLPAAGYCGYNKVQTPTNLASGSALETISVTAAAPSRPTIPTTFGPRGLVGDSVIGADIQIINGTISLRNDGASASLTNGEFYGPGGTTISTSPVVIRSCGSDLRKLNFIRATGSATNPTVNIKYYEPGA